jgi:hypothetical protein
LSIWAVRAPLAAPTFAGGDYALVGVREYVQFDPLEETLSPGLRVDHLRKTRYQQVTPDTRGGFPSVVLPTYGWVRVRIQFASAAIYPLHGAG